MEQESISLESATTYILEECRMVLPGMAPAALHRQSQPQAVARRFIVLSSRLLLAGMFPLAVGLALDAYLITGMIIGDEAAGLIVASALLAVFAALWLWIPARERRARR